MSSASLLLTDSGLALSEPKAVGAQGSTKVLAASIAGALGDRFGQKRIFLAGIALYGLGAAAIGFAPSFAPLIVGRLLQGFT